MKNISICNLRISVIFNVAAIFILYPSQSSCNILGNLYNSAFHTGIIVKQDKENKNIHHWIQEKNNQYVQSKLADLSNKKNIELAENVNQKQMNLQKLDKMEKITLELMTTRALEQNYTICARRLPFYKKNQQIFMKHKYDDLDLSVKFSTTFIDYKTSHHFMWGDTLIAGVAAVAGYYAYTKWFKSN